MKLRGVSRVVVSLIDVYWRVVFHSWVGVLRGSVVDGNLVVMVEVRAAHHQLPTQSGKARNGAL